MVSDRLNEKLDNYSERYGVSKSSIVGFVVGQWIDQMEKVNSTVYGSTGRDGLMAEVFNQLAEKSNQK
jgi:hypothetical protein